MKQYVELVEHVLARGVRRSDRTGVGTISVFGTQTRYALRDGFPLLTTKKVLFDAVVHELLWFLHGCTNINQRSLTKHTPIWDAWADERGYLGRIYGAQWREWNQSIYTPYARTVDQISTVIKQIKNTPDSRRLIVTAWNPTDTGEQALPPCHILFQFYVQDGELSCHLYQRSADIALGVPFNIASYALLTHLIATETGLAPGEFVHSLGDAHIYVNHIKGLEKQIGRTPLDPPSIEIDTSRGVFCQGTPLVEPHDIKLIDYNHHGFIKFPVAV